jgi:hypothetical protein
MSAVAQKKLVDPIEVFRARCEARAYLWFVGDLDLHDAVDVLQHGAERDGLVADIGQDGVQGIIGETFRKYREASR